MAQLTYTGFVHADPHEGNLLLDRSDGSLVFLDFGLVSEVEPYVMVREGGGGREGKVFFIDVVIA